MNKRNHNSTAKEIVLTDYKKLQLVWGRMRQSCTDVNHKSYKNYGAKGIIVDTEAWPTGAAFADWALLNGFEPGLTVERIDSAGNYTPSNVTFATRLEQQRNRGVSLYYDYQGEQLTIGEIYERVQGSYTGVETNRAAYRIQHGWSILDAINTPPLVATPDTTYYDYQGEVLTLYRIARRCNPLATRRDINRLYGRIASGYSLKDALLKPKRNHQRKPKPAE